MSAQLESFEAPEEPRVLPGRALERVSACVAAAFVVVGTAMLAFVLSGVTRVLTGCSLTSGLVLGAPIAALAATLLWSRTAHWSRSPAQLLILGTTVFFAARLFHPAYHGLVSVGGGDAGVHAYFADQLADSDSNVYHSFIGFHACVLWLERLFGLDTFQAFSVVFYAVVSLFFAFSLPLVQLAPRALLIFLVLAYYPFERIALPIIHYLQADGFFPHLFGILPLLAAAVAYSRLQSAPQRTILSLCSIALARYSYGLNLPELLLTFGALFAFESIQYSRRRERAGGIALAVTLSAFALFGAHRMLLVVEMSGGIVETHLREILCAFTILGVTLLFGPAAGDSRLQRLNRFGGVYLLCSVALALFYMATTGSAQYYSYKQVLAPAVLAVVLACAACASVAEALLGRASLSRSSIVSFFGASLLAMYLLKFGFAPLQPPYRERVEHEKPHELLSPVADREAWKIIRTVLAERNAAFGGFITPLWPVSSFTNASFGYFGELPFYSTGRFPAVPRACRFWNSDPRSLEELGRIHRGSVRAEVERASAGSGVSRVSYVRRDETAARELAFVCTD